MNGIDSLFRKRARKKTGAGREKISNKIAFLIREENKPRDQAVAIAHSLFRRGQL